MKLLAIDTSSVACSAALMLDGEVTERYTEQAREHTQLLVPMIEQLLAEGGVTLAGLDALVLGNGPGSFIGIRISASLVQGMAFAAARPVVPVSSLLAVAEAVYAERDCDEVIVAQDAHMQEVYLGRFARDADGAVVALSDERLHAQSPIEGLKPGVERVAAGAGWQHYPELLAVNEAILSDVAGQLHPSARHLLPSAVQSVDRGESIDPAEISPSYLRQEVAKPPARP